jgi:hypothetical protein
LPHTKKSEMPSHTPGSHRGEDLRRNKGPEPGREKGYRNARDSTAISPSSEEPIDPRMPHMPPP